MYSGKGRSYSIDEELLVVDAIKNYPHQTFCPKNITVELRKILPKLHGAGVSTIIRRYGLATKCGRKAYRKVSPIHTISVSRWDAPIGLSDYCTTGENLCQ